MGFDVLYLPPIHPIGRSFRKGRNNSLTAAPGDPGSPWAIGAEEGGHTAVEPGLGSLEDFDRFVEAARRHGLEIALDLAYQASPDHPWVQMHPDWFRQRPDGTIKYAENPPKKYQDIYPFEFECADWRALWDELKSVVCYWAAQGVRIFRVDNPHTKPPNFWEWLIWQIKASYPDVLFLAEAFTRPARLYGLARLGFTQSYTYFTWRTAKGELAEFAEEHAERADECRPNLFVNTPDILHASLQYGGRAMFAIRAALAATFSPTWGVYSGFELYEHQAVRPGSEEYQDSEKYQLRPRDFEAAEVSGNSLAPWLTRLNEIRRAHPALAQLREIHFHHVGNDALLAYSKTDPVSGDTVICVVTLDPNQAQEGTVWLDMPSLGFEWDQRFGVHDEVSGQTWEWGQANYVRLDPWSHVAHIMNVIRPA
jgi:starch synthase (maltosyl-transferring)